MALDSVRQPIIRGIQAVGSVQLLYRYNKFTDSTNSAWELPVPSSFKLTNTSKNEKGEQVTTIVTNIAGGEVEVAAADGKGTVTVNSGFLAVAGFRLDSEFLRANPQIASSFVIPILGGGGVALTNNNRTGVLHLICTKVSTPGSKMEMKASAGATLGVEGGGAYYDMVTLAQIQQAQEAGDSYGSTILLAFNFCGETTVIEFQGCTIATVDPIGLAGNDAVNYAIDINYLNWKTEFNAQSVGTIV
jgi:hypothetical protein